MKYSLILLLTAFLGACASKPSNEMEEISHDVLKTNRGVSITFTPVQPEK